jgi:UDP-N-acetylmuramyl pentapeptide phosphotransferase/UDP-N-acetylglucosamine-1-phosphate transferase
MDLALVVLMLVTAVLSYAISQLVLRVEMELGFTAVDVHKPSKTIVAKSGGVALMISLTLGLAIGGSLGIVDGSPIPYLVAALIAGAIGFIDDLVHLGVKLKLALFAIPSLPVLVYEAYCPRPYIPLVGHLRLTVVYPILVVLAYDVLANAFNMSDTHNGVVPSVFLMYCVSILVATALPGPEPLRGFYPLLALASATVLGYYPLNIYPAKMLNGNAGSHLIGALAASLSIASRREYLSIMLLMPQILNGFLILTSVGMKSKELIERPTWVDRGIILPNCSPGAPLSLVRLLVLSRGLTESELVKSYLTLQAVSNVVALLLYYVLSSLQPPALHI